MFHGTGLYNVFAYYWKTLARVSSGTVLKAEAKRQGGVMTCAWAMRKTAKGDSAQQRMILYGDDDARQIHMTSRMNGTRVSVVRSTGLH